MNDIGYGILQFLHRNLEIKVTKKIRVLHEYRFCDGFSLHSTKPVRTLRHRNLKPGAFAGFSGLGNRDAGDGENFTGEE
jgi:hypothetical protein